MALFAHRFFRFSLEKRSSVCLNRQKIFLTRKTYSIPTKRLMEHLKILKNEFGLTVVFLIALGAGTLIYLNFGKASLDFISISNINEEEVVYPIQYSDKNITINAIIADPRFKDLAYFDRNSLLASSISSLQKSGEIETLGPEKGTWLWTPIMDITPSYRNKIISGAKKD